MAKRDHVLLRLNPGLLDALKKWADDELRSTNAQIEYLLIDAVRRAGRGAKVDAATSASTEPVKPPKPPT